MEDLNHAVFIRYILNFYHGTYYKVDRSSAQKVSFFMGAFPPQASWRSVGILTEILFELGNRREGQGYHLWLVMLTRRAQRASHVCITRPRW
jgi:hypothetical protein